MDNQRKGEGNTDKGNSRDRRNNSKKSKSDLQTIQRNWGGTKTKEDRKTQKRTIQRRNKTQFYTSSGEKKAKGVSKFERFLAENGIKHIVGRVNHLQTNGKIERFYGTLEAKIRFDTIDEFVEWYNHKRPHMSLNLEELETPTRHS